MYLQAGKGELAIMRLFAVDNTSKPPRTQMNEQNFEFYLPSGAQIDSAQAQTSGGQAVNTAPVPEAEKGRYAFVFPGVRARRNFKSLTIFLMTGRLL